MIDELHARFLPEFLALARTRVARARETIQRGEGVAAGGMLRDLHALAGEAGLLGLSRILPLAGEAEDRARRGDHAALLETLAGLERALDEEGD